MPRIVLDAVVRYELQEGMRRAIARGSGQHGFLA
jgi:hypothetical protein